MQKEECISWQEVCDRAVWDVYIKVNINSILLSWIVVARLVKLVSKPLIHEWVRISLYCNMNINKVCGWSCVIGSGFPGGTKNEVFHCFIGCFEWPQERRKVCSSCMILKWRNTSSNLHCRFEDKFGDEFPLKTFFFLKVKNENGCCILGV